VKKEEEKMARGKIRKRKDGDSDEGEKIPLQFQYLQEIHLHSNE